MAHSLARIEVHGHRGCRGLRPENTVPGFLHATALGVDALELDVVLSADLQVVVSHEPWMNAAFCLDPAGQRIAAAAAQRQHNLYRLPYATIRQYDCGCTRHPSFPQQQPEPAHKPLLREVVRAVDALTHQLGQPAMRFSVEVKSTAAGDGVFHPAPAAYAARIATELQELQLLGRTTLLCFDHRLLQAIRRLLPTLPVCLLVEDGLPFVQHLEQLGFVPEVYGPDHHLITPDLVAIIAQHGIRLVPWTVNEIGDMKRLLGFGVNAITTDYPDKLLHLRSAAGL